MLPVKGFKLSLIQSKSDFFQQGIIKINVVHHSQAHSKHLISLEQMMKIRPGIILADGTIARFVNRLVI